MPDHEPHEILQPVLRSWRWFLMCGGGLLVLGFSYLLSSVVTGVIVGDSGPRLYWEMLYVPAGLLEMAAGSQFIGLARAMARGSYVGAGGVRRFANRLRLAVILLGSHFLTMLFIVFSAWLRLW